MRWGSGSNEKASRLLLLRVLGYWYCMGEAWSTGARLAVDHALGGELSWGVGGGKWRGCGGQVVMPYFGGGRS